jgi:YD repeat-containing protein
MGSGAMEIVGKYPAHWRASTHPTALNRVISYTDASSNHLGYEYDAVGNLVTLTYGQQASPLRLRCRQPLGQSHRLGEP